MPKVESVCVFCGASNNINGIYIEEGKKLGKRIAEEKYHMVYGAGDCGVMGAAASGALNNGGTVTGVYPRILDGIEEEYKGLTETIVVDDMHTRKMAMFNKSDAFIIMPGGFGTMDETFEVITWKQLNTHEKPIILYNFNNYWKLWTEMTNEFIDQGFASQRTRGMYEVVDTMDEVFEILKTAHVE